MKRAEVSRNGAGHWEVWMYDGPIELDEFEETAPIGDRVVGSELSVFPTYAAALAHALAKVGLTPTNPEKEQS